MVPLTDGPLVYIDDDEDDQLLFKQAIQGLGLSNQIYQFFNGADALRYLETTSDKPLLILSDLNLPIMGGIELRRYIDASEYLKQKSIPFLYFTTAASPQQVEQAYESDIQGFHVKAHEFEALKAQLGLIITYWQSCLHPNSF